MPCTLDCLQTYGCGDPIEVSPGAIYTPYMVVEFDSGRITVGNQSSPGNMAALSSLTYGCTSATTGLGCDIEIIDQGGTQYRNIIKALNKSIVKTKEETFSTSIDFGWVITDCDGTSRLETVLTLTGRKIYCYFVSLEQNYENAIIKLKIKLRGPAVKIPDVRHDGAIGDDDDKVDLKEALRRLFTEKEPRFANVEFRGRDGGEFNFKNSDGGKYGPKGAWPMSQQNPLATARTWLQSVTTENDKGILISYDPSTVSIVFMEDPTEKKCCKGSYGTYVVNGGNCLYGPSEILTEDGWKRIDRVVKNKYNKKVFCVDELGRPTWAYVKNWYRSPLAKRRMKKIKLVHGKNHSIHIAGGIFTEDHPILTNKGYINVSNLSSEHMIHSGQEQYIRETYEAFIGTMLGDAYISKNNNKFEIRHCDEQEDYLKHKAEIFCCKVFRKKNCWSASVPASNFIRKMRKTFYPNGKKIVPIGILKDFSLISLAYLFMDDGSLYFRKNRQPRAEIAVCSFSDVETELLIEAIKNCGIDCYRKKNANYNRIKFSVVATKQLSEKIAKYVLRQFDYKLLPEHRIIKKEYVKSQLGAFFDEYEIHEVLENLKEKIKTVYCIEVEKYNNFLTHSGIVHNCSPVLSFNPTISWPKGMIPGGGAAPGGSASGGNAEYVEPTFDVERAGSQTSVSVQQHEWQWRNPDDLASGAKLGIAAHMEANASTDGGRAAGGMKAELKIHGNPEYIDPVFLKEQWLSLIVINPFHITGKNGDYTWVTTSNCNTILSNKKWKIDGVSHQISGGSFVTTFSLMLDLPNKDIDATDALGGNGCGTELFENSVSGDAT